MTRWEPSENLSDVGLYFFLFLLANFLVTAKWVFSTHAYSSWERNTQPVYLPTT